MLAFIANAPIWKGAIAVAGADQNAGRGDGDFEVVCLFEVTEDGASGESGGMEIVVQHRVKVECDPRGSLDGESDFTVRGGRLGVVFAALPAEWRRTRGAVVVIVNGIVQDAHVVNSALFMAECRAVLNMTSV